MRNFHSSAQLGHKPTAVKLDSLFPAVRMPTKAFSWIEWSNCQMALVMLGVFLCFVSWVIEGWNSNFSETNDSYIEGPSQIGSFNPRIVIHPDISAPKEKKSPPKEQPRTQSKTKTASQTSDSSHSHLQTRQQQTRPFPPGITPVNELIEQQANFPECHAGSAPQQKYMFFLCVGKQADVCAWLCSQHVSTCW